MANKKNYNPTAKDGDGDGLVQDGTQWERPLAEQLNDITYALDELADDIAETPLASVEMPVETTTPTERPRTYVVKAGDSYASIAKAHKPASMTGFEYAKDLLTANSGKALRPGVEIIL